MVARGHSPDRRRIAALTAALLVAGGLVVGAGTAAPSPASAAQDPVQCPRALSLANASFEQPLISNGVTTLNSSLVPGWRTTATDNLIEIWRSPGNPRNYSAAQGTQFVEINATQASTLYQDIATTPGQTLSWSLKHRGRSGVDVMRVVIGSPGSALPDTSGPLSDGINAWGTHRDLYGAAGADHHALRLPIREHFGW